MDQGVSKMDQELEKNKREVIYEDRKRQEKNQRSQIRWEDNMENAAQIMNEAIEINPTKFIGSSQKGWTSLKDPAVLAAIKNKQVWIDRSDRLNPDDPQVAAELFTESIENGVDNQNNIMAGDLKDVALNWKQQIENMQHGRPAGWGMENDAKPVSSRQDKQRIKQCFTSEDSILTNHDCEEFMTQHCQTHTTQKGICMQWRNAIYDATQFGEKTAHEKMAKFVGEALRNFDNN